MSADRGSFGDSSFGSQFDISGTWFTVDQGGVISYTSLGQSVYKPLFAKAGIDIREIRTSDEHQAAVRKAVDFEQNK